MPHKERRNIEGWYWMGLCASIFLATTLWICWPLLSAVGAGAEVVPPAPPAATQPWYSFNNLLKRCESREPVPGDIPQNPADMMALLHSIGRAYTMQDVTEQGAIVQTTMQVAPTKEDPDGFSLRWYRGQARCEQAQRTAQQARERQRATYQ